VTIEGREVTAEGMANGFPRGESQRRAQNLVVLAKKEAALQAAAEVEKLLQMDAVRIANEFDRHTEFHSIMEAWVKATRETAEEE
jgi:hypothetical protein